MTSDNDMTFGEPKAKDATSYFESLVNEAGQEIAGYIKTFIPQDVVNRPLGSKRVPERDVLAEYAVARNDPQHLAQFFVDNRMTVQDAIKFAQDMEKQLG